LKTLLVVLKSLRENIRDWKILSFSLLFAPLFVVIMYFYFSDSGLQSNILVVNRDRVSSGVTERGTAFGDDLIEMLKKEMNSFEGYRVRLTTGKDLSAALKALNGGGVQVVVDIPPDFSRALMDYPDRPAPGPPVVRSFGDLSDYRYVLGAACCDYLISGFVDMKTGQHRPIRYEAVSTGSGPSLSGFDRYLPALLTLSIINLLFTAGGSIIREKEKKTLIRLRLATLDYRQWIAGVGITQVFLGLAAFLLTYLTALCLGYDPVGGLGPALVIVVLVTLGIVAISLLVAAFIQSVFDLMTVGTLPYFLLLFFSGSLIPLPPVKLIIIGKKTLMINEVLPTTHAIKALSRILNEGSGLGGVHPEIIALIVITVVIFLAGGWWFRRRHIER